MIVHHEIAAPDGPRAPSTAADVEYPPVENLRLLSDKWSINFFQDSVHSEGDG